MRMLEGKVALVAGATRGAGRGIAVELGAAGATVYLTGCTTRTQRSEYNRPEAIVKRRPSWCSTRAVMASPWQSIIWTRRKYKRWWRGSSASTVAWMSWSTMCGGGLFGRVERARVGALPCRGAAHAAARHRHAYHHQPLRTARLDQESGRTGRRDDGRHCRIQQCKLPVVAVL